MASRAYSCRGRISGTLAGATGDAALIEGNIYTRDKLSHELVVLMPRRGQAEGFSFDYSYKVGADIRGSAVLVLLTKNFRDGWRSDLIRLVSASRFKLYVIEVQFPPVGRVELGPSLRLVVEPEEQG